MPPIAIFLILLSTILHTSWNLLLGSRRDSFTLFRIYITVLLVGGVPALFWEWQQPTFSRFIWILLIITGLFQACYSFGLTKGYQTGQFTIVYPIARALPILFVANADVLQGHGPNPLGWLGMNLVLLGCLIIPFESWQTLHWKLYWNPTMAWVVVTAIGTIGYTIVDDLAAQNMPAGPGTAARYGVFELGFGAIFLGLLLKSRKLPLNDGRGWASWRWAILGSIGIFGAYWLVLWSYQLSTHTSYIVALRQFSIVLGVAIGTILFKEPAPGVRMAAALIIAGGIVAISLGG